MNAKELLLANCFTQKDVDDMPDEEFKLAINCLIKKGLIEMIEKDGVEYYRSTLLLQQMSDHFNSEPKDRN